MGDGNRDEQVSDYRLDLARLLREEDDEVLAQRAEECVVAHPDGCEFCENLYEMCQDSDW